MSAVAQRVAITGSAGVLGSRVAALLSDRDVVGIDRTAGHDLADTASYAHLLDRCDAVVHTAALHPLVAEPDATPDDYYAANVVPFETLLAAMRTRGVHRLVFASSTTVWREAPPGAAARFLDEDVPPDADDGYAMSKRRCEDLARTSGLAVATLRLARFARRGDPEDDVRLLYRAIDPDDAAGAVVRALDHAPSGSLYAISAPTPFRPDDALLLGRDPRAVIRARTGRDPEWSPTHIGSVIVAELARRSLGWIAAHPSTLLPR